MPHAAQLIHRTRMTVPRQTTQVLRLAATRTSRRRKSFVWRTSMWAVANGQITPPQLRLISDDHTPHLRSSTLTLSISHLGELRLQYGLSISAFSFGRCAVYGPSRADQIYSNGPSSSIFLSRAHVLSSYACALILSSPGHHPAARALLCPSVLAQLRARRVSIDPSHTLNLAEVTRPW